MKKFIKAGLFLLLGASTQIVQAQTPRMNIMEEFTSAYCPPCAQTNPGLWKVMLANTDKIFLIKYQHRIPRADAMYNQNKVDVDARATYYGVNSNPFGKANGAVMAPGQQAPNHAAYMTQAFVNKLPTTSAFEIDMRVGMNKTQDSLTATIHIKCTEEFAGGKMKLHSMLLENMFFDKAPGTNGEKTFEHVMRKMYPSAKGTELPATWAVGQTETYVISGPIPDYVDKSKPDLKFAVFIQDDNGKAIEQAALFMMAGGTTAIHKVEENTLRSAIYPNPAQDVLKINTFAEKGVETSWAIYSIDGRIADHGKMSLMAGDNSTTITVGQLPAGTYMIQVIADDGKVAKHKFVKQ